jgi:hypothetical protein
MLVTLAFGYPFNGRVYVNGNYQVTNKVQRIIEKKNQIHFYLQSRVSRWVTANNKWF